MSSHGSCNMSGEQRDKTFHVARSGQRLDRFVADALHCGRREVRAMIRDGRVAVDGRPRPGAARLSAGTSVLVTARPLDPPNTQAQLLQEQIRVLWSGHDLIAVSKPAGVHSQRGRRSGSVAAFLGELDPELSKVSNDAAEGGLVHRLDRDTSGILLAATQRDAYLEIRSRFARRKVMKHYLALVEGRVAPSFRVERPLARRRTRVVPARAADHPLAASTQFEALEACPTWSLVHVSMTTGVSHQIRAHAALAGHPIIGDQVYGGPPAPVFTRSGQLLHALRLVLPGRFDLCAAVPADFLRALAILRRTTPAS